MGEWENGCLTNKGEVRVTEVSQRQMKNRVIVVQDSLIDLLQVIQLKLYRHTY